MKNMPLRASTINMNEHCKFLQLLVKYFVFLYFLIQRRVQCDGGFNAWCIDREADALLKFREGLNDPSKCLSSWQHGQNCCQWEGVGCNKTTGHVISIYIHCPDSSKKLSGELSSSLLELPYLSYLDLSGNVFFRNMPEFLGSLHNMEYLNLSNTKLSGTIPNHLGNLSKLRCLDLSGSKYSLSVNNLNWLSGLSSLQELDMSEVDLRDVKNWFDVINTLSSLVLLRLSTCRLQTLPLRLAHVNISSLKILDLSFNAFNAIVPDWLFEIGHSLQYLNLRNNSLYGPIPDKFENLQSLAVLDLSINNLNGSIPSSLGQTQSQKDFGIHSSLKELHLSENLLSGRLEEKLLQLSELVVLEVAENNLEGVINDYHLRNFSSLRVMDFSGNQLIFNVSKNFTPPFKLDTIRLRSIEVGPHFPNWLQTQNNLSYIDLCNTSISGLVPDWFWSQSNRVEYMDLSQNSLSGCGFNFSSNLMLNALFLRENNFHCPLPRLNPSLGTLDLARNSFFGPISRVCDMLGANNSLNYLDLSSNYLSGSIPDCWTNGTSLLYLRLSNNSFTGQIPESFGNLVGLIGLVLRENKLSGMIPASLQNCQSLYLLDIGSNRLSGNIPPWIGESLLYVQMLVLPSNEFEGIIPSQLCGLKLLGYLDMAENHLYGSIPPCLIDAMAPTEYDLFDPYNAYRQSLMILHGKLLRQLERGFLLFVGIISNRVGSHLPYLDLSSNELNGTIPREITKIKNLMGLNLSNNQLMGSIPFNIGELKLLELLDLSRNQLSCTIPISMTNLLSLKFLNLSHNTLSGKIPAGNRFSTFDSSSFADNPHLCGPPLNKTCLGNESFVELQQCSDNEGDKEHDHGKHEDNKNEWLEMSSFCMGMGLGFFTGFWVFMGSLAVNRSWRYAYFNFLGSMNDMIYVTLVVGVAKLRRKFQN